MSDVKKETTLTGATAGAGTGAAPIALYAGFATIAYGF